MTSRSLFVSSGIKTGYGRRTVGRERASAQTRRSSGRRQGLKILAREVNNIAARTVPNSQADWLWDCTTPSAALTGTFVSAGAVRFVRKVAAPDSFFPQGTQCATATPVERRFSAASRPSPIFGLHSTAMQWSSILGFVVRLERRPFGPAQGRPKGRLYQAAG